MDCSPNLIIALAWYASLKKSIESGKITKKGTWYRKSFTDIDWNINIINSFRKKWIDGPLTEEELKELEQILDAVDTIASHLQTDSPQELKNLALLLLT